MEQSLPAACTEFIPCLLRSSRLEKIKLICNAKLPNYRSLDQELPNVIMDSCLEEVAIHATNRLNLLSQRLPTRH